MDMVLVEDIDDIYYDSHSELEDKCKHERCSCVAPNSLLPPALLLNAECKQGSVEDYIVYKKNSFIQLNLRKLLLRLEEEGNS